MAFFIQFLFSPVGTALRRIQFFLAIVIFAALVLTPNPPTFGVPTNDLMLHFIGNVILVLSAWVALADYFKPITALLVSLPFSLAMELSQSLLSNVRTTQLSDFIANISGILVGYIIAVMLKKVVLDKTEH